MIDTKSFKECNKNMQRQRRYVATKGVHLWRSMPHWNKKTLIDAPSPQQLFLSTNILKFLKVFKLHPKGRNFNSSESRSCTKSRDENSAAFSQAWIDQAV